MFFLLCTSKLLIEPAFIDRQKSFIRTLTSDAKIAAIDTVCSISFEKSNVLVNVLLSAFSSKKYVRTKLGTTSSSFLRLRMSLLEDLSFFTTQTPILASIHLWICKDTSHML